MSDYEWRYYHIAQAEQAQSDPELGRWEIQADAHSVILTGAPLTKHWEDLRLFCLPGATRQGRVVIVRVRSDLTLEAAVNKMMGWFGIVEIIKSYEAMDAQELLAERGRLSDLLLPDIAADDPQRLRIYEQRSADESNPTALKLAEVEEALTMKQSNLVE